MSKFSDGLPVLAMPSGQTVPVLGQGTWFIGEDQKTARQEADALRLGIDLGMTLIDTAEMYADGGAEEVVGEAIKNRRDEVFIVSKVLPSNASRQGTMLACERSLKRLGCETIDLYLLHWPGRHPLEDTIAAFENLVEAGKIRNWGVSNFDTEGMEELLRLAGEGRVAANQILYNLARRGPEFDLMPWCEEQNIPIMAYSPIEQGRILRNPALLEIASECEATPATVALAWVLGRKGVIAIPKSSNADHLRANRNAVELVLSTAQLAKLDKAFPPPRRHVPLEML
jgi:diketogulonate reductase-like aldo/keto reductase